MDAGVYQQTRSVELATAMRQYKETKDGYERLVRRALLDPDPASKAQYTQGILAENQRLTSIVQQLIQMYQDGQAEIGGDTIKDLEEDIQKYRKHFLEMQATYDTNLKFQKMLSTAQSGATSAKTYYIGYIVSVLILVIGLLMSFFFIGQAPSIADTVVAAIETPAPDGGLVEGASEAVSGASEAVSGAVSGASESASQAIEAVKSGLGNVTINIQGGFRKLFGRR
jgi:hypothetical protein